MKNLLAILAVAFLVASCSQSSDAPAVETQVEAAPQPDPNVQQAQEQIEQSAEEATGGEATEGSEETPAQ